MPRYVATVSLPLSSANGHASPSVRQRQKHAGPKVTVAALTTTMQDTVDAENKGVPANKRRDLARTFITARGDTRMGHGGRGFLPRRRLRAASRLERIRDVSMISLFAEPLDP